MADATLSDWLGGILVIFTIFCIYHI